MIAVISLPAFYRSEFAREGLKQGHFSQHKPFWKERKDGRVDNEIRSCYKTLRIA